MPWFLLPKCPRCSANRFSRHCYRYKGITVTVCLLCGYDGLRRRPNRHDLSFDSVRPVGHSAHHRKSSLMRAGAT